MGQSSVWQQFTILIYKIIALYTYETDLGDGWEDISVHNVSHQMHQNALKMGTNIIIYYLTE